MPKNIWTPQKKFWLCPCILKFSNFHQYYILQYEKIAKNIISNSEKYEDFQGFTETFMMQMSHQQMIFEPRNIFSINKELIIKCIDYAVNYDVVFLQFYYL